LDKLKEKSLKKTIKSADLETLLMELKNTALSIEEKKHTGSSVQENIKE
jgi:hypothetical protein